MTFLSYTGTEVKSYVLKYAFTYLRTLQKTKKDDLGQGIAWTHKYALKEIGVYVNMYLIFSARRAVNQDNPEYI